MTVMFPFDPFICVILISSEDTYIVLLLRVYNIAVLLYPDYILSFLLLRQVFLSSCYDEIIFCTFT
jgi:hypothetical protein